MKHFHIESFRLSHRAAWDAFVETSKNGTFLLKRAYVEYHADRFVDASLLIVDPNKHPVALLPASRSGNMVSSHEGLTYGGLVTDRSMTLPIMLHVLEAVLDHLKEAGVTKLVYRPAPMPYHRLPADEDLVALFLAGAALTHRTALAVADQHARLPFQERRRRGVKRAVSANVKIRESNDIEGYWELLTTVLRETHGATPLHTLAEIEQLRASFPLNIRLYGAYHGERLIAGVLIYESWQVARAQYIAASAEGRDLGALDLLFHTLLTDTYASKRFFDFGSSERPATAVLNRGLIEQKEGFGARAVALDRYDVDVSGWESGRLLRALA